MKTNVTSSSLASYDAMTGAGFQALQALILAKMKLGRIYTRRMISNMTKLETSCVAGRVNALIEMGVIEVCGKINCPYSGRSVEAIKLVDEQMGLL